MKSRFYTLNRGMDGMDYILREGFSVSNDFGLSLSVYKSSETYEKDKFFWYVVEESTGLSVGKGHTKAEAIRAALEAIEMRGIESVRKTIENAIEKYGLTPDHRPTYL